MFRLNPEVSDVVETCGVDVNGVTLLKMGTVERGGSGCMCSEGMFLKAFMRNLLMERDDVAVLDMEAGIEHLGRGTAENVDVFVVVVEPGARSIQTAHQVVRSPQTSAFAKRRGRRQQGARRKRRGVHARGLGRRPASSACSLTAMPCERRTVTVVSAYDVDPAFTEALRKIAAALAGAHRQRAERPPKGTGMIVIGEKINVMGKSHRPSHEGPRGRAHPTRWRSAGRGRRRHARHQPRTGHQARPRDDGVGRQHRPGGGSRHAPVPGHDEPRGDGSPG